MTTTNGAEPIPIRPITDLDSFSAVATLTVDGVVKGEKTKGTLNGVVAVNGRNSKVTVSGSLLGDIAAQIGGSLVGLFTPASVDLYKVPQGSYVVVNGIFPMCVKPRSAAAVSLLEDISPANLLTMLTSSEVARGKLVAKGTMKGREVLHYVIDGPTFLKAARASSHQRLRTFAAGLKTAEDADLYVDASEGYPVAFKGSYTGVFEPLQFEGAFDVQLELTSINDVPPIVLPPICDKPVTI